MNTFLIKPSIAIIKAGVTNTIADWFSAICAVLELAATQTQDPKWKAVREEIHREDIPIEILGRVQRIEAIVDKLYEAIVPPEYESGDPLKPQPQDVWRVFEDFTKAFRDARGPHKREMLFNAFCRSYFKPEFFKQGMSKILADLAVRIEYPEARFLNLVLEDSERDANYFLEEEERSFFARRLEALNLGRISPDIESIFHFEANRAIGMMLKKFIWDDALGLADQYGV